ncbi:MAG: Na+/H+ antiporter subunit D, partial [Acidimicrobiales bacterium]
VGPAPGGELRALLVLPVVLPLLGAGLSLALGHWPALQRALGIAVLGATLAACVALLAQVEAGGVAVVQVGGWVAPIGITLVADLFAAIMLVVSTAMVLAVLVYAIGSPGTHDESLFFHPLYLVLTAGVSASFLTGDLFNLFVAFEVMLTASYVLITLGATRAQVRSGMTYVVISLVASLLFVTAVGLIYAATGTVNMADLAGKVAGLPDGVRTALGLLLLIVFGIKAAIFPLFFWLPDSYPTAPAPVTAIFAGLLTKVGVYAIIRTQTLLFPTDGGPSGLLLAIAGATMVVGVLGAIAQDDVKRILSFHIVSQIGYMVLGLGLFSVAGIAGAIFYIVHHIVVKTSLFLVSGLLENATGSAALRRVGGMLRRAPVMAVLFLVPALSLAGLPPFSGFVAKLALVQAGLDLGAYTIVAVSLVVSLLTLFSMTKIWAGVFWGTAEEEPPLESARGTGRLSSPPLMVGATASLVVVSLVISVAAGPLWDLSGRAAAALIDPAPYVQAVLG